MEKCEPTHWGEIPNSDKDFILPDVSEDIELSMSNFPLSGLDTEMEEAPQDRQHILLQPMDPLMLYAISLHKHANEMIEMTRLAEEAVESNVQPSADAVLEVPEMPEINMKCGKNSVNYVPKSFTPFSLGYGADMPELSSTIVKQVLSKCIATMLAHIGYETTFQSILDILVDVLEDFFQKIGHNLKVAKEDEEKGHLCGFPVSI